MIEGRINDANEASIVPKVLGPGGTEMEISALIDTGFDDFLSLSATQIAELALEFDSDIEMTLADGSVAKTSSYRAKVVWDSYLREVFVLQSETTPLLGMSMLYGYDLYMRVVNGGLVTISTPSTR